MLGVAVLATCYDIQHSRADITAIGGVIGCQVLQGVEDGFCGCLTTVSTWMLELTTLRKRHAYRYGAMSVGMALAVVVILMGSVKWSRGYIDAACSTETS
jgi:CrcB protein